MLLVKFCIFSENFWWNFVWISRQVPEKSDVRRFFNQICENKLEHCRKFWNLWKLCNTIQHYLFVALVRSTFASQTTTRPSSSSASGLISTSAAGFLQTPGREHALNSLIRTWFSSVLSFHSSWIIFSYWIYFSIFQCYPTFFSIRDQTYLASRTTNEFAN